MICNKREGGRVGEKKGEGRGRTADVSIGFKYQPPTTRAMTRTLKALKRHSYPDEMRFLKLLWMSLAKAFASPLTGFEYISNHQH